MPTGPARLTAQQQQLVTDNLGLVYYLVGRLGYRSGVRLLGDQAVSVGYLALCKAALSWDAERGPFGQHATALIRRDLLRAAAAAARRGGVAAPDLDALPSAEGDAVGRAEAAEQVGRAVEAFPARLRQAVRRRYYDGARLVEIGSELGCSRQHAGQLLRAAGAALAEDLAGLAP